ncbi:AfsR/SARP family transcriptional regulator [Streptomyces sp. LHD-70]|uniref:AfsR/SARP family transcriptional regulator n=1 Tax=Streptomyces sp. LHD-70 TaxID=3072140 RepID=UPI002810172C|nr:AfsR/SARP family transcriptional regulator [Streptomyces sp. LHD-70]MDQ8706892.1 AfsR/SARP family transcriptional regulator [Streptomyces sp. LHD-70]
MLGPLSVTESGADRAPTAPKQRQMLALLLLNANRTVSRAQLVEELWEYSPPSSAIAAVHTYVMQLRRTLSGCAARDAEGAGRLLTRHQGYQLVVEPGELDLDVHEGRLTLARDTLDRGELARGEAQLRAAEDMWRGDLLVDVVPGPLLQAAMEVIDRDRLAAVSRRVHTGLRLGRHHELLGELRALTQQHPTHEELAAHLMLALYRCGRQADALDVYHRLRLALRAELGAQPSRHVADLHGDMLTAHPRLELPSGVWGSLSLSLDLAVGPFGAASAGASASAAVAA